MTTELDPAAIDLRAILPRNARIIWSHACGEPLTLIEALIAQRAVVGPVSVFASTSFSGVLKPEHLDFIRVSSMGALGSFRALHAAGGVDVIPCHTAEIAPYIEQGLIGCDVAFVQVAPAGADGRHSYGVINDHIQAAVATARIVVAEVNAQVPQTDTGEFLDPARIDYLVRTDRPLVEVPSGAIGAEDRAIAEFATRYIADGSTIQIGIGTVPDAIAQLVGDRRDLGVHSGMIGDSIGALMRSGVVTNVRKPFDTGRTVTGALIGTRPLYDLGADTSLMALRPTSYTSGDVLYRLPKLVTINSVIEVDLTGQVNAETIGDAYVGATGGQVDFVRAGSRSPGGHSILALRSTAVRGTVSRIRATLSGPVTTARNDVDAIVTEHGVAELRGQTLAERASRMIAIAHPAFREELERSLHSEAKKGGALAS